LLKIAVEAAEHRHRLAATAPASQGGRPCSTGS
jgi:hypothetical protein